MNWNDIDFSAIQNMVNSLSDEEKQNIQQMAKIMMKEAPIQEEEEELTTSQRLGWDEGMFIQLPGKMQDDLESALDLEDYYEEDVSECYYRLYLTGFGENKSKTIVFLKKYFKDV